MKHIILAVFCLSELSASSTAFADEAITEHARTRASLDLGAVDFALGGWGAGVAVMPAATPHWRFGSMAYAFDLPSAITDLDANNKGWSASLDLGVDLNVTYELDRSGKGLFFEGIVPYERFSYRHDGMTVGGQNISVAAAVGYKWLPFGSGLYVRPMLGVAVRVASFGSRTIESNAFADPVVKPLPIVHVGYEF